MGWYAELAENVWELVREFIPAAERKRVAKNLVECFGDFDGGATYGAKQLYEDASYVDLPSDDPDDYIEGAGNC